jgi:hypothetical protein
MAKATTTPKSTEGTKAAGKAQGQAPAKKVGKLDKAAKAAPTEKPAKAPKADAQGQGQQGQRAPRGQYANKKITVLVKPAEANLRGNRAIRYELIAKAKTVNEVLGQKFTRTDGEEGTITSAGIANFVEREFIKLD